MYIYLKKFDRYLFNKWKTNHLSLDDNEYFRLAILFDIEQNLRYIICNILSNNINSIGVDYSCRMIIEGMSILQMDKSKKISEIQKSIFRYSYSAIEYLNLKKIPNNGRFKKDKKYYKTLNDFNKYKKLLSQHLCIEIDELQKSNNLYDPKFYLKSNINEKISFAKIANLYLEDEYSTIYSFFSIIAHPRFEEDNSIEEEIRIKREEYINKIIIESENILINERSPQTLSNDISIQQDIPNFKPFLERGKVFELNNNFMDISNQVRFLPDHLNSFFIFFINKIKSLTIEMYCSSEPEHLITLFTPFMEYLSIFWFLWKLIETEKFIYTLDAYKLSSRIQFIEHKIFDCSEIKNHLKKIFYEFYKDQYKLKNFHDFYKQCSYKDVTYCLDCTPKKENGHNMSKYNSKVFQMIEDIDNAHYPNKYVKTLYFISRDMAHSTGYNFNATPGLVWLTYFNILNYCLEILINFFKKIQTTSINCSYPINVKKITDFLLTLILDLEDQRAKYEKTAKDADKNTKRK